ncbi:MAG: glycosyltransferase family 2 protein [Lachnospiraceae bacterium]|nr:glycosyltransferase family 2 protein [Lachnospiraceae bacterium]
MQELISVIVPIYNVEKYLERSVGSLLGQTYRNLEIILVNDGSTDRSGAMCDEFAAKDNRIKVIHKQNGGSSSARNLGIEAATGDYIGFCDSDDYTESDMYENLLSVMKQHEDAVIAQAMSSNYTDEGVLVKGPYKDSGKVNFLTKQEMFRLLMLHVGDSSFCTKLIKAEYMKQFRFEEGRLNEDFELVIRMLSGISGVYSLEKNGYNIVLRGGSNSRSKFGEVFYNSLIENSNRAFGLMEKEYPELREEGIRFWYFQRLDYMLHIPVSYMKKSNTICWDIIRDLKKGRKQIKSNAFLTKKEKRNLLILSYAPRMSKRFHNIIMVFKRALGKA